jgi:ribosomal-protein-alanine N-acetyltransferase
MRIRPLTKNDAEAIATWRYPGRYSTYEVSEGVTSDRGFWAVVDEEEQLAGYCCFGPEARVPGIGEEDGTLDVGYAMLPSLVGQGLGRAFVGAILDFAIAEFRPQRLRLLVLDWNQRSRKVAEALDFKVEGTGGPERAFLILVRPV